MYFINLLVKRVNVGKILIICEHLCRKKTNKTNVYAYLKTKILFASELYNSSPVLL